MPNFTYKNDHVIQTLEVTRTICECGHEFVSTHDCEKHYLKTHVLDMKKATWVADIMFFRIENKEDWELCERHWYYCAPYAYHHLSAGSKWQGPGWYGISSSEPDRHDHITDHFEPISYYESYLLEEIEGMKGRLEDLKGFKSK